MSNHLLKFSEFVKTLVIVLKITFSLTRSMYIDKTDIIIISFNITKVHIDIRFCMQFPKHFWEMFNMNFAMKMCTLLRSIHYIIYFIQRRQLQFYVF